MGISVNQAESILSGLVEGRIVEWVETGYYKIRKDCLHNPDGVASDEEDVSAIHENVNQEEVEHRMEIAFTSTSQRENARGLLALLSHLHRNRHYCARIIDVRDLLQMEGLIVSDDQLGRDLQELAKGFTSPTRVTKGREKAVGLSYPALVKRSARGQEIYWTLQVPLVGMLPQEDLGYVVEGSLRRFRDGKFIPQKTSLLKRTIGEDDIVDIVDTELKKLDERSAEIIEAEKGDFFIETEEGVRAIKIRKRRRE